MTCGKLSNQDPFSEKQTQWLTLQLCLVTVGATEWIECSRLDHLLNKWHAKTDPKVSPRPPSGPNGKDKTRQDKMMMMMILDTDRGSL